MNIACRTLLLFLFAAGACSSRDENGTTDARPAADLVADETAVPLDSGRLDAPSLDGFVVDVGEDSAPDVANPSGRGW
jgi:hypothetical protein